MITDGSNYYDYNGCLTPVTVKNPHHHARPWEDKYFLVPCGKCANCIRKKRNEWFFRLSCEAKNSLPFFITLTYDDNNLPLDDDGRPCFNVRHCQLFFKRLRKKGYKFRYFLASEYGSDTARPHYHAILFMDYDHFPLTNLRVDVDNAWKLGFTSVSESNPSRINYVVNYMLFKSDVEDGRQPPLCYVAGALRSAPRILRQLSKRILTTSAKTIPFILMDENFQSLASSVINLCLTMSDNIIVIFHDSELRNLTMNFDLKMKNYLRKFIVKSGNMVLVIVSPLLNDYYNKKTTSFLSQNIVENFNI